MPISFASRDQATSITSRLDLYAYNAHCHNRTIEHNNNNKSTISPRRTPVELHLWMSARMAWHLRHVGGLIHPSDFDFGFSFDSVTFNRSAKGDGATSDAAVAPATRRARHASTGCHIGYPIVDLVAPKLDATLMNQFSMVIYCKMIPGMQLRCRIGFARAPSPGTPSQPC